MTNWYTVFCKPRGEQTAEANLTNQGYTVYLPRLLVQLRRAGKCVDRIDPLFPRYLFLKPRDAAQSIAPVRSTLGVAYVVRFGAQPALVSNDLIDALRAREDSTAGVHVHRPVFKIGAAVKFVDGPLSGLDAAEQSLLECRGRASVEAPARLQHQGSTTSTLADVHRSLTRRRP